jgi:hypothetical protein
MRFKSQAQRKAVMAKYRYRIFIRPEGEQRYIPTNKVFSNKLKATTYANIETVAGMGEDYSVKKIKVVN